MMGIKALCQRRTTTRTWFFNNKKPGTGLNCKLNDNIETAKFKQQKINVKIKR